MEPLEPLKSRRALELEDDGSKCVTQCSISIGGGSCHTSSDPATSERSLCGAGAGALPTMTLLTPGSP